MAESAAEPIAENLESSNLPEIIISRKELYHGSNIGDIVRFNSAKETTIAEGIYLTSNREAAVNYANVRSKRNEQTAPSVYVVEVKDLKMADLRAPQEIKLLAKLLQRELLKETGKPNLHWYDEEAIRKTLEKIRTNSYRGLKDIAFNHTALVSKIIKDRGFDGLIAIEGGEGENGKNHDSYIIFDPAKATIKSKMNLRFSCL